MEVSGKDESEPQEPKESIPKWMRYLPSGKYVKEPRRKQSLDKIETNKSTGKKRPREVDSDIMMCKEGRASQDITNLSLPNIILNPNAMNTSQVDGTHILFGEENRHDPQYISKKARKDVVEEVSSLEVAKLLEFCDLSK